MPIELLQAEDNDIFRQAVNADTRRVRFQRYATDISISNQNMELHQSAPFVPNAGQSTLWQLTYRQLSPWCELGYRRHISGRSS